MPVDPPLATTEGDPTPLFAGVRDEPPTERRGLLVVGLLLALVPCLLYLAAELYLLDGRLGLPLDDGWIHLQFARNLGLGHGLAYNPGERVAGSTAPLWTALVSLGFLARLPPLAWVKALGIGCHLLMLVGTWRLAHELTGRRVLAGLAAALAATTNALLWGALSGMELPLFSALSVWAMALHVRERRDPQRPAVSLALFGLGALARPEGLLLLGLATLDRLLLLRQTSGELRLQPPRWRPVLAALALAALAVVPVLLVYQAFGGSPFPTTFDTKAGYATPGIPRLAYLLGVVSVLAPAQPLATLLAPAGALLLLSRLGGKDDCGTLPALWVAGLPLAYAVLSGSGRGIFGNFGRYFYPLLPVVAVLAVVAVAPLLELPTRLRIGGVTVSWKLWLGLLLLLPGVSLLPAGVNRYTQNLRDIEEGDVRLAKLLRSRLPPAATLAVDDIGALKYLLPNPVLDLAGIVSPQVHVYAHRSLAATGDFCAGVLAFVRAARPDYLAIFPRHHPCFTDAEFPSLLQLSVPGNITLGEETIVVHATPWTRHLLRPDAPVAP